ncbi:GNAT family N-acetyltransferase [Mesorhizobium australicum]|uniref:GNAT family N-acetyltransferase n=1 Tax=Mesorhizobium australicum TaxID=536018 RepID=UPI003D7B8EBE
MRGLVIRPALASDRAGIREVELQAFGQAAEADLVDALVANGDAVLELVATQEGEIVGHILFSRLFVEADEGRVPAVALAPLAVRPKRQDSGIGTALVEHAHASLTHGGDSLSVVLGDPAYYGRFGYAHERAAGFVSDYQCEALQALAWGEAPTTGRLVYAPAFSDL